MNKEAFNGHSAIILTNIIFGLNIAISKFIVAGWMTPAGFTLSRMLFGSSVFWFLSIFTKKEKIIPKDLFIIAVSGLLGLLLTQFAFALSLKYTGPVNYALIAALGPIVVLLLSALFLKETVNKNKVAGVFFGVAGAILVILGAGRGAQGANNLLGIALAAAAVMFYSVYLILMREISQKYSSVTLMKWMFLASLIVLLPFGAHGLFTQKIYSSQVTFIPAFGLAFSLVFASMIAFILLPVALKRMQASTASIYMNLQPVVASAAAIFIGQDYFSWDKPVAAALVIAGVYFVTRTPTPAIKFKRCLAPKIVAGEAV